MPKTPVEIIYQSNEKVFALDEGKLYKAKIIKVSEMNDKRHYFIHYDGWNRKYDKWAESKILAPLNDPAKIEELQKQADAFLQFGRKDAPTSQASSKLAASTGGKKTKGKVVAETAPEDNDEPTSRSSAGTNTTDTNLDQLVRERKRRIAEFSSQSIDYDIDKPRHALSSQVELPISLKKHVVDEWAVITKPPYRLLQLPKGKEDCIESIIDEYVALKDVGEKAEELLQGLMNYFNQAVPTLFLYVHEQEQLDKITQVCLNKPGIDWEYCRVYGVEHLIRFFVKLPYLMDDVTLPNQELRGILSKLHDFLQWLGKKASRLLDMSRYVLAPQALAYIDTWASEYPQSYHGGASEEAGNADGSGRGRRGREASDRGRNRAAGSSKKRGASSSVGDADKAGEEGEREQDVADEVGEDDDDDEAIVQVAKKPRARAPRSQTSAAAETAEQQDVGADEHQGRDRGRQRARKG